MKNLIYELIEAGYGDICNGKEPILNLTPMKINDNIYICSDGFGIRLSKRGENDNEVLMTFLTEDDGTWYEMSNSKFSSFYINTITDVLKVTYDYLNKSEMFIKHDFGYKFK